MVTYINKLESVPRSFTKRLSGMHNLSYTSRLEMLGLERLETRRLHADRTMCYKIVHNLVDIPFDEFFKCSEHNSTRGHPLKLFQPVARINARAHFFSVRIISLWNLLLLFRLIAELDLSHSLKLLTLRMHFSVNCRFYVFIIFLFGLCICVLFTVLCMDLDYGYGFYY